MLKSFDDVFEDVTKFGTKIKTDEYQPSGKYQIIDQGQAVIAGYTDLEDGGFETGHHIWRPYANRKIC